MDNTLQKNNILLNYIQQTISLYDNTVSRIFIGFNNDNDQPVSVPKYVATGSDDIRFVSELLNRTKPDQQNITIYNLSLVQHSQSGFQLDMNNKIDKIFQRRYSL